VREVYYGSHFRKDFKLTVKRGLNMSLIRKVMEKLENEIHWMKNIKTMH
jgi:mRNA-degrading endonuclease YafQ of YafQ-DinJ toxin-antitoxin module